MSIASVSGRARSERLTRIAQSDPGYFNPERKRQRAKEAKAKRDAYKARCDAAAARWKAENGVRS